MLTSTVVCPVPCWTNVYACRAAKSHATFITAISLWAMTWPLTVPQSITPTPHPARRSTSLTSTRPSTRPSSRILSGVPRPPWHPKLTFYRLLVILSTVGLAAAKTTTSYLILTFASITLEWILGVVVFLLWVLAIMWLPTTYVGLVSTFSAYNRRTAINISHGHLISIV